MRNYLRDLSVEIVGSIIGGAILALVFFICSDFVFKSPDLNGRWLMAKTVTETQHDSYKDLIVLYEVVLRQDGLRLSGTAEKVAEIHNGNLFKYDYEKRVRVELEGAIDRNYLSKDRVNIHWVEHGRKRDSSSLLQISRFNDEYMKGRYSSTVARSSGESEWARSPDLLTAISENAADPF